MSKIDLQPAVITIQFVLDNYYKSADISWIGWFGSTLWTPPIPPVENTFIFARSAKYDVAATVVEAFIFLFSYNMKGKS